MNLTPVLNERPVDTVKRTKKQIALATRLALEDTFMYWLKTFAPHHFKRSAFSRYPEQYNSNYKRRFREGQYYNSRQKSLAILAYRIKKGQETPLPMVKTGVTRDKFLNGNIRFKGTMKDFVAVWKDLPKYAYMYKLDQFNKHKAFTAVNPEELAALDNYFEKRMEFHTNRTNRRMRSYGTIRQAA